MKVTKSGLAPRIFINLEKVLEFDAKNQSQPLLFVKVRNKTDDCRYIKERPTTPKRNPKDLVIIEEKELLKEIEKQKTDLPVCF